MKTIVKIIFWCIAVAMLAGCSGLRDDIDDIDYKFSFTYIYENRTNLPVTLEWYCNGDMRSEKIATGESYRKELSGYRIDNVFKSDSTRVVFGDTKELWFFLKWYKTDERGAIYQITNYEETRTSKYVGEYKFIIDKSLYDRAVEIEK